MMGSVKGDVKRQYRSQVRTAAAEETRRRIREAAVALFVAHGYLGTTLREVAERAGVGERTLYDSFGGKFRLWRHTVNILTMGDDDRTPASDRPDAVAARSLDDPHEAIVAHCAIGAALMERAGDMIMVGEAAAAADPELGRSMALSSAATYDVHLLLARRLEDRGELTTGLTAREAADILATIGSPAVFCSLRRQRGWSAERYRDWMTTTLTQQLLEPT
jgi:AcrR family transcriptional regulator